MLIKARIEMPDDFRFNLFIASGDSFSSQQLHIHDCLEINYVLDGTGLNIIGDKEYTMQREDIYVINNLEYHMAFSNGNLKLLVIVFDQLFLDPSDYDFLKAFYRSPLVYSNLINKNDNYHTDLKKLLLEIMDEWNNKDNSYKLFIKANLLKALAILNRYYSYKSRAETDKAGNRCVDRAMEFIRFNFKEDITLADIARAASLNKTYLSTLFKEVMGMSVSEYLKETRLWYANYLIMNTSMNITEAALNSGFKNTSHFIRCYRGKYNITPGQNRKKANN